MTHAFLNMLVPIVEIDDDGRTNGKATPYFEDVIYSIISSLGGETEIVEQSDVSSALFGALDKRIDKLDKPDVLGQIGSLQKKIPKTLIVLVTSDYTTTGVPDIEILICANTTPITITLNSAINGKQVKIKRQNAEVTLDGYGNTIDGEESIILGGRYDSPHLLWSTVAEEYSII